jgi:hypothetical protein
MASTMSGARKAHSADGRRFRALTVLDILRGRVWLSKWDSGEDVVAALNQLTCLRTVR